MACSALAAAISTSFSFSPPCGTAIFTAAPLRLRSHCCTTSRSSISTGRRTSRGTLVIEFVRGFFHFVFQGADNPFGLAGKKLLDTLDHFRVLRRIRQTSAWAQALPEMKVKTRALLVLTAPTLAAGNEGEDF